MSDTVFEAWHRARPAPGRGRRLAKHAIKPAIGLAIFAGAALAAVTGLRHLPQAAPPPPAAPLAAWSEIVKPVRIYNLEAPAFAGAPVTYTARRHTIGDGREDVLALGTLDGNKPAIRLRIFRKADEAADVADGKVPLYAALVHEAARVGLAIGRSGLPDILPTRFGRFEIADVSLAGKDGTAVPCGGFRVLLGKPALSITGLACGRSASALSHADIGCLIERLDVASARDDRELIDFFAASELRRNAACTGMRLGPDGLHAPWLDDKAASETPSRVVARDDKPATARKRLRHR